MKRIGGLRRKSRNIFKKHRRERGKLSIKRYMQRFNEGDVVRLVMEPSVNKGIYHPIFHGRTGTVKDKRGKCYEILITDRGKQKTLIVHPIHLQRM